METKKQLIGLTINYNISPEQLETVIRELSNLNLYDNIDVSVCDEVYDNLTVEELPYFKDEL